VAAEARLLIAGGIWLLGLLSGLASLWVGRREMGDPAFYLKGQLNLAIAQWGLLWLAISTLRLLPVWRFAAVWWGCC